MQPRSAGVANPVPLYAAFVFDPDGTNVESVNHGPLAIEVSAPQG